MKLAITFLLLAGCGAPFTAVPLLADRPDSAPDAQTDGGASEEDGGGEQDGRADAGEAQAEATVEACSLVTHDDGIGQHWQDCAPLGTYTQGEAEAACRANGGAACVQNDCAGAGQAICDIDLHSPGYCSCWVFAGALTGHVNNTAACTDAAQASCVGSGIWQ